MIAGFMVATGYKAASGMTQKEWMLYQLRSFVVQRARTGDAMLSTNHLLADYTAARTIAMKDAIAAIPDPTTTIN